MRTWVKILVFAVMGIVIFGFAVAMFMPDLLPSVRGGFSSVFGGIAAGFNGALDAMWSYMSPIMLPNLRLVFIASLIVAGIFGMYFGHKITEKARSIIGVASRKQIQEAGGFTYQGAPQFQPTVIPAQQAMPQAVIKEEAK